MAKLIWTRFGPVSRAIAKTVRPLGQPVLIISLPRSGSSWVGKTLGLARNALYLREPISQAHLARQTKKGVVFTVNQSEQPPGYHFSAETAFAGLPHFPPMVLKYPEQWKLRDRRKRRLVIKEVNPLALGWLIGRYRPRVIYLVRHPAAVAASFERLGWLNEEIQGGDDQRFSLRRMTSDGAAAARFSYSAWAEHGALQGAVMRSAMSALADYPDQLVIKYEDICADPQASFARLYRFAGLDWDARSEEAVHRQSNLQEHNRFESYSTYRNSRAMVGSWKEEVHPRALAELNKGFRHFAPPFYSEEEW